MSESPARFRRFELLGVALLGVAVAFNAVSLAPELDIGRFPLNDATFHLAAAERLAASVQRGEPFLDPWVSEWSLGYPVWRSYQPLPHLLAAALLAVVPDAGHAAAFAALQYLLLVLLPASIYLGARLLGLRPLEAGLGACLALAPSTGGEFGRYGLGYGAFVWRGSGLFTQLVALHLLVLGLGIVARALDTGRRRPLAALFLALTSLSHIVFGYVAFVSSALLALVGPRGGRAARAVRLAAIVLLALPLLAWFVVPLALDRGVVNHSRWEEAHKWDSFGAPVIVKELATGRLFDGGRAPVLSLLLALGAAVGLLSLRDAVARRLAALATAWLLLFFGRVTWGHLLLLVGVPRDLHLHRLQAAFELSVVLLAAWGLAQLVGMAWSRRRALGVVAAVAVLGALVPAGLERARYLGDSARWGEESLAAVARERADLEAALADVRAILAERPGRVSAGKAATWGREFKVGSVPVYAFLTREHLDEVSFLYHSMSLPSDVMVLRDEASAVHDVVFAVRAVIAPADLPAPPNLRPRARHGRFAVYEASREGYFGLVDIGGRYTGPAGTEFEPSSAWLASVLPSWGIVVALGSADSALPPVGRWQPLPPVPLTLASPRGRVLSESKEGETYRARLELVRPCHALVKITWDPGLVATVDGVPTKVERVTPGFAAVAVGAGTHEVVVRYAPGPLRRVLLLLGIAFFAGAAFALRSARVTPAEDRAVAWLATRSAALATPRRVAAFAVLLVAGVALRPLLRGQLIAGHDATEYPPRLVEFARAVGDGHIPPVWAPDLGNGYGQPLFGFAPPLLYTVALPFHWIGLRLTDAIQFGLVLLYLLGAVAVYRLGRRWHASRPAAVVGATAWLFVPYVSLDLFVRSAFAEAAAVAVTPIALLALLRACDRPSALRVGLGAAAVALVILGHNAVALLVLPALGLVVLVRVLAARPRLPALLGGGLTLAAGLALSAFFWLPALAEKGFVKTDLLREGFLSWSEHIVVPLQLLWSRWGYGLSGPGTADQMSFAIGPLHLLLAIAGLIVLLRGQDRVRRTEGAALAAVAVAGCWLATTLSAPLWARLETLQYLAYPWRALLLPALCLPLVAVPFLDRLPRRWLTAAAAVLVLLSLPHTEPKGYLTFDDEYYAPASIAEKGINTTTREEYEPRWVGTRPPFTVGKLVGLEAPLTVVSQELRTARQEFLVRASAATQVEAATFFYPGWHIAVDGQPVENTAVPVRGTMTFALPAGEHRVVLELDATRLRRASQAVSVAAVLVLLAGALVRGDGAASAGGTRGRKGGSSSAPP